MSRSNRIVGFIGILVILGVACLASMLYGSKAISASDVFLAMQGLGDHETYVVVAEQRVPRTWVVIIVGAALGVAGALMQALTRNPLADPGILGINAGASLAVVTAVAFLGIHGITAYVWFALVGATLAAIGVYLLGGAGRANVTPAKLTLAGVAISMAISAMVQTVLLSNQEAFNEFRYWASGSVEGRGWDVFATVAPFIVIGLILALITAPALNALALGDDTGKALGVQVTRTRTLVIIGVTLLAGAATAAVGPIMFVGLAVPYLARNLRHRSAASHTDLHDRRARVSAACRRCRPRHRYARGGTDRHHVRPGGRPNLHSHCAPQKFGDLLMTNFAVAATSDTVPQATTNTSRFRTIAGIRLERNAVLLGAILVAIVFAAMIGALSLGDYPMTAWETVANLFGFSDDYLGQFFVQSQRLPRVMATIAVGAALGVSGCIFQQLSGNTLGSPDIIGFTTGSATGAVVTIIVLDGSPIATAVGALLGGAGAALAVYALTLSNGKLSAARLVLVGIGMASILSAVNALLMVKASINAAQTAAQWLAGSFNATTWGEVGFALSTILVLVPVALLLARPLSVMITGDDLAIGLGVDVERRRRELMIVGVALTAISVAVAGPIAFVALAAPQLARRISRASGIGMGNAALMGAALVAVSDIIAQRIFAPTQLPVGVVTGLLGGVYLVWLLGRQWRK